MRILYFFPEKSIIMHQWQRFHFVEELPHYGIELDTLNPLQFGSFDEANEVLLRKLSDGKYDLFFTNLCGNGILWKETLVRIKEMGIPSLSFRGDNLLWAYNDKEFAPYFDLVWLTSIETQYLYDRWGVNSFFAPYASNPFTFVPHPEITSIDKACFVGTPYGSRSIMINCLTKSNIQVDVYCKPLVMDPNNNDGSVNMLPMPSIERESQINTFKFKEGRRLAYGAIVNKLFGENKLDNNEFLTKKDMVTASEQSKIYSSYRLSLATTSAGNTDILNNNLPVLNLRSFEIPMSGGLAICRYNKELSSYFEADKEVVFYHTKEEYIDKANYYLMKAPESTINKMKNAARLRAEKEHSWLCRFSLAFEKLGLKI